MKEYYEEQAAIENGLINNPVQPSEEKPTPDPTPTPAPTPTPTPTPPE